MVRTPSDISIFFKYYDFLGVVKDSFIYWRESSDTIPYVRATSHTRLRAHDHSTSSTLIGRKKLEPVRVHFTLRLRDQRSMWMQDGCGCKVYMDSYMASNRSCFMVTWIVFKTHLLEVGLKQNWETMHPKCSLTVGLFYFIMCEDQHEQKFIEIAFDWAQSHMAAHYTWGSMTTLHDFGDVLGHPLDTLFGISQIHGHGSWLVCEVALSRLHCHLNMWFIFEFALYVARQRF